MILYDEYLNQAMEAGVKGYLFKDIKGEELTQAIRRIQSGEVVISESIVPKLQFGYGEGHGERRKKATAQWSKKYS